MFDGKKVIIVCVVLFDVVGISGSVEIVVIDVVKGSEKFDFVFVELMELECFEFMVVEVVIFGGCGM